MFVYWSKCLLDARFAGLFKLRQRKQRPKSGTFPYHQLIFCACVLYGFLIGTHTNTHWKSPTPAISLELPQCFLNLNMYLTKMYSIPFTVYRIPTSRDTCNHKRIQTLPKTSHRFGTWRKFAILLLIAQTTYTLVSWISGTNGTCWTQSVDKAGKGTCWTGDNWFVIKSFSWHTHKTIRPLQCSGRNDIIWYVNTPCNLTTLYCLSVYL